MNSEKLDKTMLILSLVLNILLTAGMLWMGLNARQAMLGLIADSAASEIDIQKQILADLESDDPVRMDGVKAKLRLNIDVARRMRYKIETGTNQ